MVMIALLILLFLFLCSFIVAAGFNWMLATIFGGVITLPSICCCWVMLIAISTLIERVSKDD